MFILLLHSEVWIFSFSALVRTLSLEISLHGTHPQSAGCWCWCWLGGWLASASKQVPKKVPGVWLGHLASGCAWLMANPPGSVLNRRLYGLYIHVVSFNFLKVRSFLLFLLFLLCIIYHEALQGAVDPLIVFKRESTG